MHLTNPEVTNPAVKRVRKAKGVRKAKRERKSEIGESRDAKLSAEKNVMGLKKHSLKNHNH